MSCPDCGNNPVNHVLHWYFESVNVLFTPLRKWLLHNPLARGLTRAVRFLQVGEKLVGFLHALGVIGYQNNVADCKVARAKVLWEEANKRGWQFSELLLLGRPFDTYLVKHNDEKLVFSGLPRPSNYDDAILELLDDKWEFKKMLRHAGLPVPAGGCVTSFEQARKIFAQIQKPVIVKPRSGSRGRHSTTYIYSEADLKSAFAMAKQLCYWVMVEEHLFGPVYRATVINYQIQGVLRGDSPQVVGDGVHNLRQLVEEKNQQPHEGVKDIVLEEKSARFVSRQIKDNHQNNIFDYLPPANKTIYLSEKIGVNYGGSSSEDFSICHPDNLELFEQAAKVVGEPIVGFDFIIPDITQSYKQQRCGFIEANTLPFINLHHDPLLGQPRNVAAAVWDLVGFK